MEYLIIVGILLFVVLAIWLIIKLPGYRLARKFKRIGDLRGMDLQHLVSRAGMFKSSRPLLHGNKIYAWHEPGYRISIVFDLHDKAVNINSQTKSFFFG